MALGLGYRGEQDQHLSPLEKSERIWEESPSREREQQVQGPEMKPAWFVRRQKKRPLWLQWSEWMESSERGNSGQVWQGHGEDLLYSGLIKFMIQEGAIWQYEFWLKPWVSRHPTAPKKTVITSYASCKLPRVLRPPTSEHLAKNSGGFYDSLRFNFPRTTDRTQASTRLTLYSFIIKDTNQDQSNEETHRVCGLGASGNGWVTLPAHGCVYQPLLLI